MLQLILKRLGSLVFVLFSLTFITFLVGHLAPGDPIQGLLGNRHDPARYAQLLHDYGFDRPLYEQYGVYLLGLLHGDLGKSFKYAGRPVADILRQGVPVSFTLGIVALLVSTLVGVPAGAYAALHHNRVADRLIMLVMLALFSVPSFVLIPVLRYFNFLAYDARLPSLPVAGWGTPAQAVLPVFVLAAASAGYITRLTRATMLEVLREDYIRTARAKGLPERVITMRHALRNAFLPVITVIGPSAAFVVTGAFVVESIFSIPGVGFLAVQSIGQRDYPVIQATTLLLGAAVVLMNLVTDLLYTVLDPRIRLRA
ncbi:MAG TPA: ABC transporter permease [Chloroflexia bacterium]|nr:ABC transporter permease [Chloroflexia bacterium]